MIKRFVGRGELIVNHGSDGFFTGFRISLNQLGTFVQIKKNLSD